MTNEVLDQSCTTTSSLFNNEIFGYDEVANGAVGETFTPSISGELSKIIVRLNKGGSPTDNVLMYLYSTSSGHLPVSLLATSTTVISGTSLTTSMTNITFYFTGFHLTAGEEYAWVLARSGASDTVNNYRVNRTNGTDDYSGYALRGANPPNSATSSTDRWFEQYVNADPGPASPSGNFFPFFS